MPTFASPESAENELTQLLLRAVPENEYGNKTLRNLALLVPCSRHSVHKWIKKGRIPPDRVMRIVEIGKLEVAKGQPGRVRREEFDPFVYKAAG